MDNRKQMLDKALLNVVSYLESCAEVHAVNFRTGDEQKSNVEIIAWEKSNAPFKLPLDLKNFYLLFNTLDLSWSVENSEKDLDIGEIRVRKISEMRQATIVDAIVECRRWKDIDGISVSDIKGATAFVFDQCDNGDIAFIYQHSSKSSNDNSSNSSVNNVELVNSSQHSSDNPSVWLIDCCGRYHYICSSFKQYLRLMVTHLGIRGWQAAFTPEGLPPLTQQWMNVFCKERLVTHLYFNDSYLEQR
jgi:hypothetical protein